MPEIVTRIAERLVARGDEVALILPQIRDRGLAVATGERCLEGGIDLAIEPRQIRIGADRLLDSAVRARATEARQQIVRSRGAAPVTFLTRVSEILRGLVELWIDLQRLLVIGDGMIDVALFVVGGSAVVVGEIKSRIERDSAVIVGDGAVRVILERIRVTAVGQEVRLRLQFDRLVVVGDGAVVVMIGGVVQAAIIEIFRMLRIEFDRLAVIGNGLIDAAEFLIGCAAIGEGARILRIKLDGLVKIFLIAVW